MRSPITYVELVTADVAGEPLLKGHSWILSGASSYFDLRGYFFLSPSLMKDPSLGTLFEKVLPHPIKFDVKVGDKRHEALAKQAAIFMIVKHLCDQGVTPEDIESCLPWRSNMFSKADGTLNSAAFVKVARVDSGGIRRYFCGDDELIRCNGKTYAVANGRGKRAHQAIQSILARFPDKSVTCERHGVPS